MLIHMLNDTGYLSAGAFLKCLQRFIPKNNYAILSLRDESVKRSIPITNMMGDPNLEYEEENCREYESPLQPI
uniref:Transposase n=1 Tax=Heterorhabditis bacteriophora TaxID=37862 RepID=A0A1I7W5U0_HETBA